jgi:hypothetical protein
MHTKSDIYVQESHTPQATAGLERFFQSRRNQEFATLVGYMEDLAQHQPVAFIGSMALLGFLASQAMQGSIER